MNRGCRAETEQQGFSLAFVEFEPWKNNNKQTETKQQTFEPGKEKKKHTTFRYAF